MAEPSEIALTIASIAVALALAVVTYFLARHTANLAHATEGLRTIEQRRERAEARRRRIARLTRKIELTHHVLGWDLKDWKQNYFIRGAYPRPEGDEIKELATLIEYGKDHANKELMEGLVRALDLLAQGVKIEDVPADNLIYNMGHLSKLREDISRWRDELMVLSAEEAAQ